ncbi:uncharacterized protein [Pleurodeles waltl]
MRIFERFQYWELQFRMCLYMKTSRDENNKQKENQEDSLIDISIWLIPSVMAGVLTYCTAAIGWLSSSDPCSKSESGIETAVCACSSSRMSVVDSVCFDAISSLHALRSCSVFFDRNEQHASQLSSRCSGEKQILQTKYGTEDRIGMESDPSGYGSVGPNRPKKGTSTRKGVFLIQQYCWIECRRKCVLNNTDGMRKVIVNIEFPNRSLRARGNMSEPDGRKKTI